MWVSSDTAMLRPCWWTHDTQGWLSHPRRMWPHYVCPCQPLHNIVFHISANTNLPNLQIYSLLDPELISYRYSSRSSCLGDPSSKKPKASSFQIQWGCNSAERFFMKIRINSWNQIFDLMTHTFKMAAMTSFHTVKCCHLVSIHEVSAAPLCSSVYRFLIYSAYALCDTTPYQRKTHNNKSCLLYTSPSPRD